MNQPVNIHIPDNSTKMWPLSCITILLISLVYPGSAVYAVSEKKDLDPHGNLKVILTNALSGSPLRHKAIQLKRVISDETSKYVQQKYTDQRGLTGFQVDDLGSGAIYVLFAKPYNSGWVKGPSMSQPGNVNFEVGMLPVTLVYGEDRLRLQDYPLNVREILLDGSNGWSRSGFTDASGRIIFDPPELGNGRYYQLMVKSPKDGAWKQSRLIALRGETTFNVDPVVVVDAKEKFQWNRFSYPVERYAHEDAIEIADTIIALQRPTGGWGKLVAPDKKYSAEELAIIVDKERTYYLSYDRKANTYSHKASTIDNGATHEHIRFLLRVAEATQNRKYEDAALNGIEYLLKAQTETGGWAQNYPNLSSYGGHVTFNDGAMVGAMTALQEAKSGKYSIISDDLKISIQAAVDHGVEYILKSQIIVNGEKTAWCAQHNRNNYQPEGGRIYELPSISGAESVGIVKLLMRIDNPTEEVMTSIISAVKWFESVKIDNIKVTKIYDNKYEGTFKIMIRENPASEHEKEYRFKGKGYDKVVVPAKGRPMWARFYDIETQHPIFVGWDGIQKDSLDQIDFERRTGYRWYGYWSENLLKYSWPKWKDKLPD